MRFLRPALGFLTVMTLGLTPAVSPVGPFVKPSFSATAGSGDCVQIVTNNSSVTVTKSGSTCILQFQRVGTTGWTVPNGVSSIDYLLVGGGGGGGGGNSVFGNAGGGGGGGGFSESSLTGISGSLSLEVGDGGSGGAGGESTGAGVGSDGSHSFIRNASGTTLARANGGYGADRGQYTTGGTGGRGGNSGNPTSFSGGSGPYRFGGGGGGASGAGANGPTSAQATSQSVRAGAGGTGRVSSITGLRYGGGGGGGAPAGLPGLGGSGGGGAGGSDLDGTANDQAPIAGTNGRGGGGGGGDDSQFRAGADGGSGVVVVRYSLAPEAPTISSVSSGDGSIDVTFSAPSHTGGIALSDYIVEYKPNGGSWSTFSDGVSTATSVSVTGLDNGTSYTFRVSAKNTGDYTSVASSESSAVTPRAAQTLTWSPSPTFINTDITTSVSLSPLATVLGGVSVTYAVSSTTGTANCTISDSSTPTVSSISGSGTCVVTATSAQGEYEQATASVTLTVFDGAGSGNSCDQNVSGTATVVTHVLGADCLIVFSAASSASWAVPDSVSSGKLLLVAGGGGGGTYGGGGAGELFESTNFSFGASAYTVTVGAGGAGSKGTNSSVNDGSDSVFGALTANGGGSGGSILTGADNDGSPARDGGSGGGGRSQRVEDGPQPGGASVLTAGGVGFPGGSGNRTSVARLAGGGGGAGGAGGDANTSTNTAGDGGIGAAVSIFSVSEFAQVNLGEVDGDVVRFAGGGAGNRNGDGTSGSGGLGGGGDASQDGLANSGGGGGGSSSTSWAGWDGGSGVVIVRYTRSSQSAFSLATSSNAFTYNSTATLSASGGSGTGTVTYAVTSGACSISGTTVTATGGTGSCVITATKAADASYIEATSSVTLTLSRATQASLSIAVNDSALDYGDTATLSSSGGSGTGAVTFSVDSGDCSISGTTVTATGGTTDCVISAVKAADDDYVQASAANTVTISISKASQTITFASISNLTYGASAFTVSPTSDSGLTVSVSSSTSPVCTTSGLTVTLVGVGTCTLTANQAGNSFYSSATGVTRSFTVSAKAITVSVSVADKVYDATTSATVSSGTLSGVVSGDVVSFVAGNAAAAFGSATVGSGKAVSVTLDGDELAGAGAGNYSLSVSGSPTATITAKPVTVNVVPGGKTYDGTQTATVSSATVVGKEADDTVSADRSKVSVTFDAPGAGTQSASATLASGVLTGADAGNYTASVGTVSSAVISKANQASLSFTSSSSAVFGQTLTLVATGGSGSGSLSYSASGDCTIAGSVITPTGAGSCSVSATRAADSNYNISSAATQTVTIAKANQSINFTSSVPVSAVAGTTYTPTATATSGLTPSFSITTGSGTVCSLASGVVTFLTSGTCVITAAQGGDSDYNAATSVTQTIVAGKINQTISFPSISGKDFDDAAFLAGATVSSGRTVTFATSTGSVCGVNASTGLISIKTIGDCTVTASSAGDSSYAAASDVSRTFTISPVLAGKPSVTSVSFGNSSVTVAFTAPGANGGDSIDAYQVVATSSGGSVTKPDCSTTSPCTITGLTNGESYTLTIAAINAAGVGPASDASPAVIPATIPDAVSALSTTPGNTQLVVDWSKATSFGGGTFTRYEVYLRVRGNSWGTPVSITDVNTETYTFTGLTNGTAYDVKIVTISTANGSELSSNTATALGVPATAPDAPTGLTLASLSNTSAVASWTAPADDGGSAITSYSVNLSCTFVNNTDTFCTLTGLTAGSRVTVTVGATNLMGTGSTVSAITTMPGGSPGGSSGSSSRSTATDTLVVTPRVVTPTLPGNRVLPRPPVQMPRILNAPVTTPADPTTVNDPARVLVGGRPVPTLTEARGASEVNVRAGKIDLGLGATTPSPSSTVRTNPSTNAPELTVGHGESTSLNVRGLLPGSTLQVWLPGADGRELARVPVNPDGSVTEEISLTASRTETPLPLGRQVLQVTGFDEDGNQTVVDMTINIAQGAPSPEPNRLIGELPDLQPGQSLATSAGVPETVTISANVETREVSVSSNEWSFRVTVPEANGTVDAENPSAPTIRLIQARTAEVNGDGFQPDTRVDIFLFSDPTLLGSFTVTADGSFDAEVFVDARFAAIGDHTLQIQGVGTDGYVKAANLGVLVEEPVELSAESASNMLWWAVGAFLLALVLLLFVLGSRRRRNG